MFIFISQVHRGNRTCNLIVILIDPLNNFDVGPDYIAVRADMKSGSCQKAAELSDMFGIAFFYLDAELNITVFRKKLVQQIRVIGDCYRAAYLKAVS